MGIKDLEQKIQEANIAYRKGNAIISDAEYDDLCDRLKILDPENEILNKIGFTVDDDRKSKLPIDMASMNKIKCIEDLYAWCKSKNIDIDEETVLTPKLDGLSLATEELHDNCWTRGDGVYGQKSNEHYKLIKNHLSKNYINDCNTLIYTYGEVIMPKQIFIDKYCNEYKNPRNLVAGCINSKEISPILSDCLYIKYGGVFKDEMRKKSDILDYLNKYQDEKIPYEICKISDITEEKMKHLFEKWSTDFEIDGVIIELNNISLHKKLGRETSSNNPSWARAYKSPIFEVSVISKVIGLTYTISKQGLLKPVIHIEPVNIGGVIVSNVTGNNAKYIKDMGIGVDAVVSVKRSGQVIPQIVEVIERVEFQMPNIPDIDWNESGVELVTLTETDEQKLKKIVAFFEILEVENCSEGVLTQLWDAGYKTIKDVLNLKPSDMENLDGFGKRKSEIVYKSIQSKIKDIPLSKLQHATGIFKNLGSKKLALLEHFETKPSFDDILAIEGFAETSAMAYLVGYDEFYEFVKDLPVTYKVVSRETPTEGELLNKTFVFTGVRRSDLEKIIESKGGKIGSSVSRNTTHLVMKEVGTGSSKEKKALELGITIITVEDLENMLREIN